MATNESYDKWYAEQRGEDDEDDEEKEPMMDGEDKMEGDGDMAGEW